MSGFSVRKPFTVLVAVVAVFALGIVSLRGMTPELLPNLDLPYVIAITTYPGATPDKVEQEVTRPLEQNLSSLESLNTITSQSRDNVSVVMMEFADGADLNAATIDILQKTNQVEGLFDDMVGTPLLMKINLDMLPVMVSAVTKDGSDTTELSHFISEELRTKLEATDGVASLSISGLVDEAVNTVLREDKIAKVNRKIAKAIGNEFAEQEYKLQGTQATLEKQLSMLDKQLKKLDDTAKDMAKKAGAGEAEIADKWADLIGGKSEIQAQLTTLKASLQTLIQQEEAAKKAAGGTLPPAIQKQFDDAKSTINDGIKQLNAALKGLTKGRKALKSAQAKMATGVIQGEIGIASGNAQLIMAKGQLSSALTQITQGLTQLDDARDAALKKADMKGALTMDAISGILKAQNFSMPAGYVSKNNEDYLVRVGDEVKTLKEMENLVLMDLDMKGVKPIKLKDVSDVFMGDNIAELYAKINGGDGVVMSFSKQSEKPTTEVSNAIATKFDQLSEEYPGLQFIPLMNQGDYIYEVLNSILSDLLFGAIFSIIILLLFLRDLRPTLITLCAIPISLIFAVVAMYFCGVTINIISLSGLAIVVGRLVDDSVVVIENIFRLRAKGFSAVKAAVSGAGQVAGAIASSTLTTICVFLPIVFVQGITRQLFSDMALTVAFSLLASLFIALTLVPTMAGGLFKKMQPKPHKWLDKMLGAYDKALVWSLAHKAVVLIVSVVLLAGSAAGVLMRGFEFIPEGGTGQITASLELPPGVEFDTLKETTDTIANKIRDIEGVETVGAIAGGSSSGDSAGGGMMMLGGLTGGGAQDSRNPRTSTIYVLAKDGADSKKMEEQIEATADGTDAKIELSSSGMSMSALGGTGVEIDLLSDNAEDLIAASEKITETYKDNPAIAEINNGLEDAAKELHFTVDKAKAAKYELTVAQVFQYVNTALTEEKSATTVRWETADKLTEDTYNVIVVNGDAKDDKLTPSYIKNYEFTATKRDGSTEKVKLGKVTKLEETKALPMILRSDQQRHLPVTLTLNEGYNITLVSQEVEASLASVELPKSVTYKMEGENATIMESLGQLGIMMLLGVLLIYLIMVAQFQSLKNPFIVMFAVPLAFTGGFLALLITGMELSVISMVGFIMLMGIIVSNAIVLIDYVNRLRQEGAGRMDAIREGAATRMRPILMTALTTIGALSVMAVGIDSGSMSMQPLAIVCVGGLIYGTLMTLFVIPIIYDAFNKKEMKVIAKDELVIDREA